MNNDDQLGGHSPLLLERPAYADNGTPPEEQAPRRTVDYIVVQAGGKGTRLEHLTANKPKALVPVENLPMIFHLFRKFPDKKFVVIADTHREVLREYLAAFADVDVHDRGCRRSWHVRRRRSSGGVAP